jgi:phosphate transport system ATP-binding protein
MNAPMDLDKSTITSVWTPARSTLQEQTNHQNTSEQSNLIQTTELGVHYRNRPALVNINLTVHANAITAVIGPSGCGKTSFLNCLNRMTDLITHCRVTGEVIFERTNIFNPGYNVTTLRRRVGMIFQKPNPFPLSIWKNLQLPLTEHGMRDRDQIDHVIETSLLSVGLWNEVKDRLNKSALQLSGGQQQRLCIARALVLQPEVILLDEPCSALDPLSGAVVEDLIAQLRTRYTIVIVTHNLAQAKRIADYTALFWLENNAGRLVEFGTTRQIFHQPQHALTKAYISGSRG